MARRITQYQSRADVRPLNGSFAERTTPDKYASVEYLPFGNPVAKAGALALLASVTALAFVPIITAPAETVTVDKWHQLTEQPSFTKARTQYLANGYFAPDRQQVPDFDSWVPQPNQPQFDLRRSQYLDPSSFTPERQPQPRLDSWAPLSNQPQFDQKRTPHLYPSHFGPDQQPKPRLDSWFQPTSEPVRLGADKRVDWQGISALGIPPAEDVEEVTPDRWQPNTAVPQFDISRRQYLYPSSFAPDRQSQPRLDSWFQPASEPVRLGDSRIQRLGASELDLTPAQDLERTSVDKYEPGTQQPQFDLKRLQYLYPSYSGPDRQPDVRVDSWYQQANEPVRVKARKLEFLGESDVQLTAAQEAERISADKWHPLSNQPLFDSKRQQHTYEWTSYDPQPFQNAVYADRWWQQPNQPQFDRKQNQYLYPSYFAPEQQPKPRLDSWWQQASEPVRLPDRRIQTQGVSVLGVPPAADVEEITPDRWQPNTNQPQFDVRRAQYLYPSFFASDRQPQPRVDSWFQPASEPVRLGDSRIQRLGASELDLTPAEDIERASADKWHPATEQPLFDRNRTQYTFEFAFFNPQPFPSPIFADKWHPEQNQPIFPRDRRVQIFGDSELQLASFSERTTPDKWQPAIEQPLFARARNQYLYPSFFGPDRRPVAAAVALDWLVQASEPVRKLQSALFLDAGFVSTLERVTVDKWFQPISEPVRVPVPYRHLRELFTNGNGAAERVSADKWHPELSQPLFDIRRLQYLYPNYFGPDRQPTIALDWFVQPNQPQFYLKRLQHLYPNAFALERQSEPRVDTWWVLGNQPLFDIARNQYLYPALFFPELPLPKAVSLDEWWQLSNQPVFDVARLQYLYPSSIATTGARSNSAPYGPIPGSVSVSIIDPQLAVSLAHASLEIMLARMGLVLVPFVNSSLDIAVAPNGSVATSIVILYKA